MNIVSLGLSNIWAYRNCCTLTLLFAREHVNGRAVSVHEAVSVVGKASVSFIRFPWCPAAKGRRVTVKPPRRAVLGRRVLVQRYPVTCSCDLRPKRSVNTLRCT